MEPIEAAAPSRAHTRETKPVASYVHTFFIVLLMLGVGLMSAASFKKGTAPTNPLLLYIPTIIWLWSLALLTYVGMRFRGTPLHEVLGRTWQSFDDFLMDIVIAVGFWLGAFGVIVLLGFLFNALTHTPKPTTLPPEFQALAPRGVSGILTWIVLSITAGMCEEFVFRGYLQRQFAALTRSAAGGIVLSACIFSVGHLYEGAVKATVIGVFGMLLGILAHMRRSLVPGIIAHTWHDVFSGFLLSILGRVVPK
jgi:membrane protease YdiL (CAAX protease family)